MLLRRFGSTLVLRLETGENIHESLVAAASAEKITLASVTGISALQSAILSFFDPEKKKYLSRQWNEDLEIASLNGNLTMMNGKPYLHLHAVIGDRNFNTFGGHL